MMLSYFLSYAKRNVGKTVLLILNIGIYFAFTAVLFTLSRNMGEIATLPFRAIGVDLIVQKTGQIPEHMTDAIFPHSNGPIFSDEVQTLRTLPGVDTADTGLYFWYFDNAYFKDVFGVDPSGPLFPEILKRNIISGTYDLSGSNILVSQDFAQKNSLSLGGTIALGKEHFTINGFLRSNITGNIIPAGIYMNEDAALRVASASQEMQRLFHLSGKPFVNVVVLKRQPNAAGDLAAAVQKLSKDYLIFGENTFSQEILDQLAILSSFGKTVLLVFGALVILSFGLVVVYNLKTRGKEIAVLRTLGWSVSDIERQFIGEHLLLVGVSLVIGNILTIVAVLLLSGVQVALTIPWEISAKPHFLVQENAIDRIIKVALPVRVEWGVLVAESAGFLLLFLVITILMVRRLRRVKPSV